MKGSKSKHSAKCSNGVKGSKSKHNAKCKTLQGDPKSSRAKNNAKRCSDLMFSRSKNCPASATRTIPPRKRIRQTVVRSSSVIPCTGGNRRCSKRYQRPRMQSKTKAPVPLSKQRWNATKCKCKRSSKPFAQVRSVWLKICQCKTWGG